MTYTLSSNIKLADNPEFLDYAQKMTLFTTLWHRALKLYFGSGHDIHFVRIFAIFREVSPGGQGDPKCHGMVMTMPGQENLKLDTKPDTGCVDFDKQFGGLWTKTLKMSKNANGQMTPNISDNGKDPFGNLHRDVISFAVPIYGT